MLWNSSYICRCLYWYSSLFVFIFKHIKICCYSYIAELPFCRWVAGELLLNWFLSLNIENCFECWIYCWMDFVNEDWILYWMLDFPKNSLWIAVGLIFITEHWTFRWMLSFPFNLNFFACWIFVEHWNLKLKGLLLNIEIPLKMRILPEYWILNIQYWNIEKLLVDVLPWPIGYYSICILDIE